MRETDAYISSDEDNRDVVLGTGEKFSSPLRARTRGEDPAGANKKASGTHGIKMRKFTAPWHFEMITFLIFKIIDHQFTSLYTIYMKILTSFPNSYI